MGRSAKNARVSKKISHLEHEGTPHKQAIAMAINMEKKHRITPSGGYRHVRKGK
jgi:hypothetical protein